MLTSRSILWRRIVFTFLISLFTAYIIIARHRFFDISYYLSTDNFWLMYVILLGLQWLYMLSINIIYATFIVYLPGAIKHLSFTLRFILYFSIALFIVVLIHVGLMAYAFRIGSNTLRDSGYLQNDFFYFFAVLMGYLLFLVRYPHLSIFQTLLKRLFKGAMDFAMQHVVEKPVETMVLPSYEGEIMSSSGLIPVRRIRIYSVLLFYYSKANPSFIVDTVGQVFYIDNTSSSLAELLVKEWIVRVNTNTHLNMWHFDSFPRGSKTPLLSDIMLERVEVGLKSHGLSFIELCTVSDRLRGNVTRHYERRDSLSQKGWDQYFEY